MAGAHLPRRACQARGKGSLVSAASSYVGDTAMSQGVGGTAWKALQGHCDLELMKGRVYSAAPSQHPVNFSHHLGLSFL